MKMVSAALITATVFLVSVCPASAQSYQFTKVLDAATQRPDNQGLFAINTVTTPAFDGQWVVFRDNGNKDDASLQAIWSFNTADKTFHKLADLHTVMPGGTATFTELHLLDTAPTVRSGTVIFLGRSTSSGQFLEGLYSVPAAGGAVTKVADYTTADPSGGTFSLFDSAGKQVGGFSFDGTTVAFHGQGSGQAVGIYTAQPNGSLVRLIADNLHPFVASGANVNNFSTPAVSGNNVVMMGVAGSDASTGYNGIYLGTPGANGVLTELVNSKQQLPGNTNANFHTRFDAPVLAIDGTLVAFRADDSASTGFSGLYSTDLTSHAIARIADATTTVGSVKLTTVAAGGVSVNQGSVLFKAGDTSGGIGLYLWKSGTITRVVGSGDTPLGGPAVRNIFEPGPGALFGSGVAFVADVGVAAGPALYLATPAASPITVAAVTNSASYGASSIAPGEVVTVFGTGIGPATLASFQWDANNRIPASLAGVRILFNGTPAPLLYVSDKASAGFVPFAVAGAATATVQVEYAGNVSPPVTVPVTNTMPGVFSADYSGSGPGAISYPDGSYNTAANPAAPGTVVVLWLSGLGVFSPPAADGSVVPGLAALQFPVTVSIGGKTADIQYQGPAPVAVAGLYQINCVIPPGTPPGPVAVVVTSDGKQSQPNLTVAVK